MKRLFALPALLLVACGSPAPGASAPKADRAAACDFGSSAIAPFAAEWPAMWGVDVKAGAERGVLMASFDGCTLRLLPSCRAEPDQPYDLVAHAPSSTRLEMRSADDVRRGLPMGEAELVRELPRGGLLRFEAQKRGSLVWKGKLTELTGDCEGATHFVRAIEVGAYALDAVPASSSAESPSRVRSGGEIAACASTDQAALEARCSAMLQLVLEPLPTKPVLHAFDGAAVRRPETERERAELCAAYKEDKARLDELLAVQSESLVSPADKARFLRELEARYGGVADVVRGCLP